MTIPKKVGKQPPTPLARAIGRNDLRSVEDLLQCGADVNQAEGDGLYVIGLAVILGYAEMVRLLLDNGADVNAKGEDGVTPLMKAVNAGHAEIVRLLIDRGADVNAASKHGFTALMYSVLQNNKEALRMLLEQRADVSPRDFKGRTARDIAETTKRTDMLPPLKQAEELLEYHATAAEKQRRLKNCAPKVVIRRLKP